MKTIYLERKLKALSMESKITQIIFEFNKKSKREVRERKLFMIREKNVKKS